MLFSRSHAWTQLQKRLIVGGVLAGAILCAAGIYEYERAYRGPSESAFYGTWQIPDSVLDSAAYLEFRPDHTFFLHSSPLTDEERYPPLGKWYAGGPNLYVRFDADQMGEGTRPQIWHIVDVQPNEFRIRYFRSSTIHIYKRGDPAATSASNQTMERTADRRAPNL
jgi:hypothetical protein